MSARRADAGGAHVDAEALQRRRIAQGERARLERARGAERVADADAEPPREVVVAGAGGALGGEAVGGAQGADLLLAGEQRERLDGLGDLVPREGDEPLAAVGAHRDETGTLEPRDVGRRRRGRHARRAGERGDRQRLAAQQLDHHARPRALAERARHAGQVRTVAHGPTVPVGRFDGDRSDVPVRWRP